jgi:hypothetical protein
MTGNRQKLQELELGPRAHPSSPLKGKGLGAATVESCQRFGPIIGHLAHWAVSPRF